MWWGIRVDQHDVSGPDKSVFETIFQNSAVARVSEIMRLFLRYEIVLAVEHFAPLHAKTEIDERNIRLSSLFWFRWVFGIWSDNSLFVGHFMHCIPVLIALKIRWLFFFCIPALEEVLPFHVRGWEVCSEWCFPRRAMLVYTIISTFLVAEVNQVSAFPKKRPFPLGFVCLLTEPCLTLLIYRRLRHAKSAFKCSWISLGEMLVKYYTWFCAADSKRLKQQILN